MTIRIECLSIDAHDPAAQAQWWAEALDWRITEQEDDECVIAPPESTDAGLGEILFAKVPDDKVVKNRLHLDLRPDDQAAEVARFEQLGARQVDIGQSADTTWVVLARPREENAQRSVG